MSDQGGPRERGSVSRDREILCALFDATNNAKLGQYFRGREILQDGWQCKDGWKTARSMGQWYGVTTNVEGRVTGLKLHKNCLAGVIPPQLGGLDVLEELHLYHNKLQGSVPKELGKLGTLKKLYLGWNALEGAIPPELGDLKVLEHLRLNQNNLQGGVPKDLGKLRALKKLELTGNPLGGDIPPELGDLTALQGLQLGMNQLTGSIPPALGGLHALTLLDLSRNNLDGTIPAELGKLGALYRLDLSRNQLTGYVPVLLGNLRALTTLDLSNNTLKGLWDHTQDVAHDQGLQGDSVGSVPRKLCRLVSLLRGVEERKGCVLLHGNPWAEPPEAVVTIGLTAVCRYFDDLYCSPCRVQRNSVKVVIVGQEGAGKTSLRQSMKTGRATPTVGSTESTVCADVESMELNGVSVRVYDCAGQVAYTGLLQMFLTPRAVCLVVCDAGAFGQRDSGEEEEDRLDKDMRTLEELRVCCWLRCISQRVPGSDVILVATKCDLAGGNAADVGKRMDEACRKWLASWANAGMKLARLEDGGAPLTSCCASSSEEQEEVKSGQRHRGKSWECDWIPDVAVASPPSMLDRVVNKLDGSGTRGATIVLPNSWDIALTVLEAFEHGMDPVGVVVQNMANLDGAGKSDTAANTTEPFKGITVEDLNSKWKAAVLELSEIGINVTNADNALEGALSIREFEGSLVRHETFVFLDVIWLTRILKPLFNHKDTERVDGSVILGSTGDTQTTLTEDRHIQSWNRLKKEGILEPELARVIWPRLVDYVLPTLSSLGLTFPLEHDPAEGEVVLLRLGRDRPRGVGEDIDDFRSRHSAALSLRWTCFLGVPPGAIEKVLTRCCRIGAVQTFWRFGVLIRGAIRGSECRGSFALVLEYTSDSNQLDVQVYGDTYTVAPWAACAYAISAVRTMAIEFPGLRLRGFLECPKHGEEMLVTSTARRPGEKVLHDRGCNRCSRETGDIGAAAVEVVRMVDVRQDRGVVFREMNVTFDKLQPEYPTLRAVESRDRQSSESLLFEQLNAARETFLKDMKEDLETVLRSTSASAFSTNSESRAHGQGQPYQDWKKLQLAVEDIQRQMGGHNGDVQGGLEASVSGLQATSATMMDLLAADDGVMGRLDFLVAMLMTVRGEKADTPRQACFLPGDYAEPHGLSDKLRRPEVWTEYVEEWRESDFKAGKGVWKTKMRLFLICAHTHQLVPCGHNGRGYDIQRARKWVRITVDLAQLALQVTCASLAAVGGAQLPTTTLRGVGKPAVEAALTNLEAKLKGLALRDEDDEASTVLRKEVQGLTGNAYKCLRTFVHDMEDTARMEIGVATKKAHKERRAPPSTSDFVYFDQVMVKVQPRTGDGEAQWVLSDFEKACQDAARNAPMHR